MSTLQISLPDELHAFAESQAREEGFASTSNYIAHLLHEAALWAEADKKSPEQKRAELVELINEGLQGEAIPLTGEVWADFLGECDEKLRAQVVESNLRESFVQEATEPEPTMSEVAEAEVALSH